MQHYTKTVLESEGFSTLLASNGADGVTLAKAEMPDLIVMDAEMPVMGGFEAIEKLRADPKCRMIPVILVTGLKQTADRIRGIKAGCDNYLSKPYDPSELLAQIKTLLTMSYYRALVDEKEKFDYVMNHMNSGIVVLDPVMRLSQINQKARELLGLQTPETKDLDVLRHVQEHFQVLYGGTLSEDLKMKTVSFDLERPESEKFQRLSLSVSSSAIRLPTGELNSVVMMVQDVTEQRKNDFLKLTFMDFVSHKLLTPLTSIDACLTFIQEGNTGEEFMGICVKEFNELKNRIQSILSFCKALRGDTSLPIDKIVFSEYLSGQVGSFPQTKSGKKIEYEIMCPDKALHIFIEGKYFDLVLRNLVDNGIEHNDQPFVKIRIEVKPAETGAEIRISDNGRGIPPEEYDRVFENFYQIDKWSTGNLKGVGLGLSIVKHIVERHGGSIRIESSLGKGTCVILNLAFNPRHPARNMPFSGVNVEDERMK